MDAERRADRARDDAHRDWAFLLDGRAAQPPAPLDPAVVAEAHRAAAALQDALQAADREADALAAAIGALRSAGATDDRIAAEVGVEAELVTAADSGRAVLASILSRLLEPRPRGRRRREPQ